MQTRYDTTPDGNLRKDTITSHEPDMKLISALGLAISDKEHEYDTTR